jgi:quinoprotein glucose dehydrogenase
MWLAAALGAAPAAHAQLPGTENGEWRYWGGDSGSNRYSPLDQINADNFEDLEVAWVWRGDNFGPSVDNILRSTPIYVNGRLYGVAGQRRTAVAIDPATGETLWTFREAPSGRWERSMRKNYGKGVAYAEVDGQGRIYLVTPSFKLHSLNADSGYPVQEFGQAGTVDLLADFGYPYDEDYGIPDEIGYITNSSPPIVVNDVVVVGNSHEQGYHQTRRENVPGHILAYDAKTGKHLWKFNVIPQPGEFGHETWKSDAWSYTGNVSTWAPMSADPERGLVYIATDPPTNDYWSGFAPGDNLFSTSIVALDVKTGERRWHFQVVHHDVWNYDNPVAPNLLDVTVDGQRTPILVQTTKQSFAYVLNRETGEPVWPIEERPVPTDGIPGESLSPTQPFPTKPAAYEMQGVTEDDLIDFTPEMRAQAIELMKDYKMGPLFNPPIGRDNAGGYLGSMICPGGNGGTNIPGGTVVDVETGILYTATQRSCGPVALVPGAEVDVEDPDQIGKTVMEWVSSQAGGGFRRMQIEGLPFYKPPYSRITAIDLNTGETLWWIPNGDTPERIANNPALKAAGIDIANMMLDEKAAAPGTGNGQHATALVTGSLLMYGEGRGGQPRFHAVDKATGKRLGTVELPAPSNTAPMTYMHEGAQYIVVPVGGGDYPGSLVALTLF